MANQCPTTSTQNVLIHRNNASPNKTQAVVQYLDEQLVQILPHPFYGPDLTACDFWLFLLLKDTLAAVIFVMHAGPRQSCKFRAEKYSPEWLPQILH